jgi:hypothetical protein
VAGVPQLVGELGDAWGQAQRVVEQQNLSHAQRLGPVPDGHRPECAREASGMMAT